MKAAELKVRKDESECGEKIHLFVDARNGSSDAVVAIRWCICPSILEAMKKHSVQTPHLLLVVTLDDREVDRKCVPLEQEMEYIYFQSPGQHRIQATILCPTTDGLPSLKNRIFSQDLGRWGVTYYVSLVDHRGDLVNVIDRLNNLRSIIGQGEISVDVASEFFAKKPAAWVWKWANLWYETKPRDQCQFRRRCMLAFSVQPIVVVPWVIIICLFRFLAALFLGFGLGIRGIRFHPARHPFSLETNDVWYRAKANNERSVFLVDKNGNARPWFLVLFMPAVMVCFFGTLSGLKYLLFPDTSFWWVPVVATEIIAGLTLLGYLCILAARLMEKIIDFFSGGKADRQHRRELLARWRKEQQKFADLRTYDETYAPLVCRGVPLKARLDAIPKQRRTIYLRFMDLKTKVCRPFARQ